MPDTLAISIGVLVGELHRLFLAPLIGALATIAIVGRDVKTNIATFLTFDMIFQWLGLMIIFVVAIALSRTRSTRSAHWLAVFSLVVGLGVRLVRGQYTTGGYPLWYEIAFPLGTIFAWAVGLWCFAGQPPMRTARQSQ